MGARYPGAALTILVLAAALASPASACSACKDKGRLPCRLHTAPLSFPFRHSLWVEYRCCLGTGFRVCPKCKPEKYAAAYEQRLKDLTAWLTARRRDVEGVLFSDEPRAARALAGNPLRHAESDNVRLVTNMRPLQVPKCRVPAGLFKGLPHKSLQKRRFSAEHYDWIVLKRVEDAFQDFKTIMENTGRFRSAATNYYKDIFKAAEGKYDIFLWDRVEPHKVCGRKFFGTSHELGTYKHGARLTAVVGNHAFTKGDEMLFRYLTHMVHHLFLEAYDHEIGYDLPSWIPEGFAHYMEYKKFGDFKISCFWEREGIVSIPGKLTSYVARLVATKTFTPAASIIKMGYNQMDTKIHVQIWSLFHYLIEATPRAKFRQFIREVKRTRDQLASFKTAYGYSLILIDEPWQEFVRKTYMSRKG